MKTQESDCVAPPAWQQKGYQNIWMPYCQMMDAPMPVAVASTSGVRLHLDDGRTLIDAMASWWSACHGYNHPHILAAMHRQIDSMPHVMFGGINHEPALSLASRLAAMLPGNLNRVFFADSGSVAVEVAMKMAIQFHRNQGRRQRTRFVSFENAYHGDTTGAMSLCDPQRSMHAHFNGALLEQINLPIPRDDSSLDRLDRVLAEQGDSIAAVFIEPLVQGAGGMRFHSSDTLASIAQSCRRHDVLLIADELATGFGRTGSMFAIDQAVVVPDIICLGKALTAGAIGFAATVATDQIFDAFLSDDPTKALMHGPTFMANPLACAAANASLDLFERESRLQQVRQIESLLSETLAPCRKIPHVVDVRVKGAIGVIQVDRLTHVQRLRDAFVQRGIWLRPFGDCIYTTPPLVIQETDLRQITAAMVDLTHEWSSWDHDSDQD